MFTASFRSDLQSRQDGQREMKVKILLVIFVSNSGS